MVVRPCRIKVVIPQINHFLPRNSIFSYNSRKSGIGIIRCPSIKNIRRIILSSIHCCKVIRRIGYHPFIYIKCSRNRKVPVSYIKGISDSSIEFRVSISDVSIQISEISISKILTFNVSHAPRVGKSIKIYRGNYISVSVIELRKSIAIQPC